MDLLIKSSKREFCYLVLSQNFKICVQIIALGLYRPALCCIALSTVYKRTLTSKLQSFYSLCNQPKIMVLQMDVTRAGTRTTISLSHQVTTKCTAYVLVQGSTPGPPGHTHSPGHHPVHGWYDGQPVMYGEVKFNYAPLDSRFLACRKAIKVEKFPYRRKWDFFFSDQSTFAFSSYKKKKVENER